MSSSTNILHVSVENLSISQLLLATTADRRLHLVTPDRGFTIHKSNGHLQDSPILSCAQWARESATTVTTGMSGQVIIYDHMREQIIEERRDHKKYVVKVIVWGGRDVTWIATAGWDAKVFLYRSTRDQLPPLGPPIASVTLQTNPETLAFISHPDTEQPILLVTRRDSTSLHYYALPSVDASNISPPLELQLLGRQNLAPHSNAWIAFSPSSVAISPTDPGLLAVATSAVPHMKLIIVRLLHPSLAPQIAPALEPATQAAQSRANLAIQDREDAAILVHVSTMAPQTPYSTPQVVWRHDGTGVWVNGDDGVVRGLEAKTGNIVATLKNGHEIGSKIRSIWCGLVDVEGGRKEEWVGKCFLSLFSLLRVRKLSLEMYFGNTSKTRFTTHFLAPEEQC